MKAIIEHLDHDLKQTNQSSNGSVEANAVLSKAGLLRDSKAKPLREMLCNGWRPHALQSGGKGSGWTISHSTVTCLE